MKKKAKATEKLVKIIQLGATVQEVGVDVDATVEECLEAGGFDTNVDVKCKGDILDMDDIPADGDRLVLADKVKGA